MPRNFEVELDGRIHHINVERGADGSDVVRVNGRMAGRPVRSDGESRSVRIEGVVYTVERKGGDFRLAQDLQATAILSRELSAVEVLGKLQPDTKTQVPIWVMWGVAILAIGGTLFSMARGPSYRKLAVVRVSTMLNDMQAGPDGESAIGVSIWAANRRTLSAGELHWASPRFDRFRQEKGLYRKFNSYEVVRSEDVEGEALPTARVTFRVDGGPELVVRVPKDQPMTWE